MKNKKSILLATGVVIFNLLYGHFLAPIGMLLTPIVLTIVTILIVFGTKGLRPLSMSLVILGLILVHDIGLKLYAGGTHDSEGQGLMNLLFFLGLIPSYILIIIGIVGKKKTTWTERILAIVIFTLVIAGYIYLFNDLGLGRHYWYDWN